MKQCLIPKVIKKGHSSAWETDQLSKIVDVHSGRDYKSLKSGSIPVYGTGGYMLSVDDSLSDVDAIGIGRKGTIDNPQFLIAPFWTVDTLFFLTAKKDNNLRFIFYLSQNIKWKRYDESTGVPSLSKTSILKIPVNFPSPNEQAAIANVLNKADCLVDESKKKIMELRQLKRLLLGKAFSLEWRFRGFNDPWEQRKLKDLSTDIGTGKSIFSKLSKSNINDYKVLGSTSIIGYSDDFDYEGNFILTARVGANAGNIYRESGKVKISDNTVFIKAIQSDFLYYVLMNFNLKRLSFGTGQPLIKSSELKNLKLQVSVSDSERKKLGLLFVTTDNLIVANERQEKIALIRSVQFSPTSLINFEYFR